MTSEAPTLYPVITCVRDQCGCDHEEDMPGYYIAHMEGGEAVACEDLATLVEQVEADVGCTLVVDGMAFVVRSVDFRLFEGLTPFEMDEQDQRERQLYDLLAEERARRASPIIVTTPRPPDPARRRDDQSPQAHD